MSTSSKVPVTAAGSMAAQRVLCMQLLKARPHHTYELRQVGISHPAARMQELIDLGVPITSSRITTVDGDGYLHSNVALYSLTDPDCQRSRPRGGDASATDLFDQCLAEDVQ